MPKPIVIADYDPEWPALFEAERVRILAATGDELVAIEHIGSTAVPGLGAKPIIDIMGAVRRMSDDDRLKEPLASVGYQYIHYPEFPERLFFRDGPMGLGPHYLLVAEFMSEFWNEKLAFRDFLRARPDTALDYHRLKKNLATKYGSNREKYEPYTNAKTPFIESVLASARMGGCTV